MQKVANSNLSEFCTKTDERSKHMDWWETVSTRPILGPYRSFVFVRTGLKCQSILFYSGCTCEQMWKSGDRMMGCEKLILLVHERKYLWDHGETNWPQIWELPFPERSVDINWFGFLSFFFKEIIFVNYFKKYIKSYHKSGWILMQWALGIRMILYEQHSHKFVAYLQDAIFCSKWMTSLRVDYRICYRVKK